MQCLETFHTVTAWQHNTPHMWIRKLYGKKVTLTDQGVKTPAKTFFRTPRVTAIILPFLTDTKQNLSTVEPKRTF
jgi:hypothetical protein